MARRTVRAAETPGPEENTIALDVSQTSAALASRDHRGPQRPTPEESAAISEENDFSNRASAYRDWSDRALAAAVVGHREDAYAELVRRHSGSVSSAIRMLLGNGPSCDDVVATVFAEFWFGVPAFDPGRGSLLSFLRMRARNHSMDMLRSEASRRRREEDDLFSTRDPATTVDERLLASETAAALRGAVSLLPPTEREVIQLAYFDGMPYRAVAEHLDLAEGTVKSRIRTALRRLRMTSEFATPSGFSASAFANAQRPTPARHTANDYERA